MGIMDSLKTRLGSKREQEYDDEYDDYEDDYDDYEDDYDDGYDDEYDEYDDEYDDGEDASYEDEELPAEELDPGQYQPGSLREKSVRLVTHEKRPDYGIGNSQYINRPKDRAGEREYHDPAQPEFMRNRGEGADAQHRTSSYGVYDPKAGGVAHQQQNTRTRYASTAPAYTAEPQREGYRGVAQVPENFLDYKVISPVSYNEGKDIASTFKSGQAIVLTLKDSRPELGKRILDFSFGVASALGGRVEKLDDRVFLITHSPSGLAERDLADLRSQGVIR